MYTFVCERVCVCVCAQTLPMQICLTLSSVADFGIQMCILVNEYTFVDMCHEDICVRENVCVLVCNHDKYESAMGWLRLVGS